MLYAIARTSVHPSVLLSICASHGWFIQKNVEVRIMQLSPQSSPMPLVFAV